MTPVARLVKSRERARAELVTSGEPHVPQPNAPLRDPLRGRDGHPRRRLAPAGHRDRRRVRRRPGAGAVPPGRAEGRGPGRGGVFLRPRLRARAGRQGAPGVRRAGPQPRQQRAHRRRRDGVRRGLRAAVRARGRGTPGRLDGRLPQLHPARAELLRARLGGRDHLRAEEHAARLPPSRHDLRAADADRQDLHGQRGLRRERRGHPGDDRDPLRRPGDDRADAGDHLADQLQLPAALGRPDARGAVRLQRGQPGRRDHAVHPDGRDVAGVDPGDAGPADGRGAHRHRAVPADPPGLPGDLRIVPVEHRHAVRVTQLRHAGVGDRAAVHRPDRPALRAAVALRRRADVQPDGRRAGRLRGVDDHAADLPRRHQLGDALRRLAGGRAGGELREVRARRAGPGDAAARVHPAGDRRGVAGLRRARRGPPRRPLPRRRPHHGTVPHLLLPAVREQLGQLRPVDAQRREGRRRPRPRRRSTRSSTSTSPRRSTTRCARSWPST